MSQVGGSIHGRGMHGFTFDAVSSSRHDNDTFQRWVKTLSNAAKRDGVEFQTTLYALSPNSHKLVSHKTIPNVGLEWLEDVLHLPVARCTVVKMFTGANASRDFHEEMTALAKISKAYGATGTRRFTTIASMPFRGSELGRFHGLVISPSNTTPYHFIVSRTCTTPLDRYTFRTTADVFTFVVQILESFAALHAGSMLHCDVKLSNMIACDGDPMSKRFKLIDWGLSDTIARVRSRYLNQSGKPKNYRSPIAYFAFGASASLAKTMFLGDVKLYRHMWATASGRSTMLAICRSFDEFVTRESHAFPEADEFVLRRRIIRTHIKAFDLFSLGMVFYQVAATFKLRSASIRRTLEDIARRLTHIGSPDHIVDAREALRQVDPKS